MITIFLWKKGHCNQIVKKKKEEEEDYILGGMRSPLNETDVHVFLISAGPVKTPFMAGREPWACGWTQHSGPDLFYWPPLPPPTQPTWDQGLFHFSRGPCSSCPLPYSLSSILPGMLTLLYSTEQLSLVPKVQPRHDLVQEELGCETFLPCLPAPTST